MTRPDHDDRERADRGDVKEPRHDRLRRRIPSSGPATVSIPDGAESPWYPALARATMSPPVATAVTISPPAPTPCSARRRSAGPCSARLRKHRAGGDDDRELRTRLLRKSPSFPKRRATVDKAGTLSRPTTFLRSLRGRRRSSELRRHIGWSTTRAHYEHQRAEIDHARTRPRSPPPRSCCRSARSRSRGGSSHSRLR